MCVPVLCQDDTFSGQVVDSQTQSPLQYANVGILGKLGGSVSNEDGFFVISTLDALPTDSVSFSFIGYEPLRLQLGSLTPGMQIQMIKRTVELGSFSVTSREYTPIEIIDLMKENFSTNHSSQLVRQEVFHRDASYTTIHNSEMTYLKSSFHGIDKAFVKQFNEQMPEQLNIYTDNLLNIYNSVKEQKAVPIKGQTLREHWSFDEEFSKSLFSFADDIESGMGNEENYFKVRSGVFAGKMDFGDDSLFILEEDVGSMTLTTESLRGDIRYLVRNYSTPSSKYWDFIEDYKLYTYTLSDVAIINDELAYVITFEPKKRKGKFKGTMCVATNSFALVELDYSFVEGKTGQDISLLGVSYTVEDRSGRVIYEKRGDLFFLKYLYRESKERYGVDRTLSLKRKQENGLFDKTLQEVKIKLDMDATFLQKIELLVVSQDDITPSLYKGIKEPTSYKIQKVDKYSPEFWKNTSIIEPSQTLKDYKKQF